MECKSIQTISSSSTSPKYDVFLSFRGEDVRNSFADHLFAAFQRNGIVAFRDDSNLKQGKHISTELVQAIEGSQVLMVVFSKNYATSTWCLQELTKMVDCSKERGQSVMPIFYHVTPSEVRKQSGDYGEALDEHEERFKHDLEMVQQWRGALVQMAALSGWDIQNKGENGEIEKIVERVRSILLDYKLSDLDSLVGMHSRVEQFEKLMGLNSNDDVRVVGICGMGGIGKTTLARAVYDRNFHQYGACCFIDDISKTYRDGGLISAQKQLICQIMNEEIREIWNLSKANYLIKTKLRHQTALIVLDNVDEFEQLQKLGVSRDGLRAGSRIIVISRDRHILSAYGMDEVYNVQLLNEDEAHQLFCRKAFQHNAIMGCDDISREYKKLTDLALQYAQCLPLAIEVLGSFLCGRDISEWRSALTRLKDNPKKEIMDVLQISFDGLEPLEREIFLDIACFFKDKTKMIVMKILDYCGLYPNIGMRVLIDKSLITIKNGCIEMHDMLQELGKNIVRQKAPNEPWKWSRIWRNQDFQSVMIENTAMDNLEAIQLSSERGAPASFRAEALSRINRLRLLIINNDASFSGSLNGLSNELRYLEWTDYPFTYFPSSCKLTKLVELHLRNSNIKQLWKGKMPLDKLKHMDLSGSRNLVKTPDVSEAPNLVWLLLDGCKKLEHIHPSTGRLRKLTFLFVSGCTSLMSIPISIFGISSLGYVCLDGCSRLFHSKEVENARHGMSDTAIQCQSTISSIFKRLKLRLPFHFFNSRRHNDMVVGLSMLSLARLSRLRVLDLRNCNLVNIPEIIASLCHLEGLLLGGNNFVTLPCFIRKLPRLEWLELDHCKQLTSLSEFPLRMPDRTELLWKRPFEARLGIFDCPKLVERESCSRMALSWMTQFLKVHKESTPPITIVIPGTRIPSWFSRQRVGNSITIESFPNVHDDNWIGIALCAAFVAQYNPPSSSVARVSGTIWYRFCFQKGKEKYMSGPVANIEETDGFAVESVHLCLLYFTREQFIDVEKRFRTRDLDGSHFKLEVGAAWPHNSCHLEVKNWGMHVVFRQDLEELNGDGC